MIDNIYFHLKLEKKQSLMYQIMIILMEEHKKARLAKNDYIGNYDGGDVLTFDKESWKKMKKKIKDYITVNYKETFSEMHDSHIIGLFPEDENILCSLRILDIGNGKVDNLKKESHESDKIDEVDSDSYLSDNYYIIFRITNKGYSYQYNGYKKSQDKLQRKANLFLLITTIYYLSSWVFPNYDNFKKAFFRNLDLFRIENSYLKIFVSIAVWEVIRKTFSFIFRK
ncbi:hypothetical protein ABF218_09945 [Fusobacterium pseudoperiodonticum]